MKKLALAISAIALGAGPALADHHEEAPGRDFSGVYGGSYTCADGEHGFYLDLSTVTPMDDHWMVSGTLGLFPTLAGTEDGAADVAGSFAVSGTVSADMQIELEPGEWLVQPPRYGAAHLTGELSMFSEGQWQIEGKPVVPGMPDLCSALVATQFLPAHAQAE
ncbi:MAG: hypothetical protein KDD90_08190 [Sphingomonadaceae bacterium]|jgi:hypothetical protein|nr:hypothetical protein [Sphingomonadaceae bacterium]